MEPFLGTILAFGFNFPPRGWAFCNGNLMPIARYTALFSLLGTYYGGDGKTTFGLPNLQGRTAIGFGANNEIGEAAGATSYTMTTDQMPAHNHTATSTIALPAYSDGGNASDPTGATVAVSIGVNAFTDEDPDVSLAGFNATGNLYPVGNSFPVGTMSPYLVLNYCIALQGIFPSRN